MSEPDIFLQEYWRQRLFKAISHGDLRQAVYLKDRLTLDAVDEYHRKTLEDLIEPGTAVLDAGCGYGRLYDLLPELWRSDPQSSYLGVDLVHEFITLAQHKHHERAGLRWMVSDLRIINSSTVSWRFNWTIVALTQGMLATEAGDDLWNQILSNLKSISLRVLLLDYSPDETPTVIPGDYRGRVRRSA